MDYLGIYTKKKVITIKGFFCVVNGVYKLLVVQVNTFRYVSRSVIHYSLVFCIIKVICIK